MQSLPEDEAEDSASRELLMQFLRTGGKSSPELISMYEEIASPRPSAGDADDTLYFACERHQLDMDLINGILAERPAALSTPRDRGWLPIHHAAMANSYDAVEFLLKRFPGGAAVEQDDGFMPLHMAVYFEDVDSDVVAMILKAHPAAAQHRSKDGRTALHIALENPNMDIKLIRLLLDAHPGAARVTSEAGQLPLHLCAENKQCSVEVFAAVLAVYPEAVQQRDAPPRRRLPLHYAVGTAADRGSAAGREAFVEIVKILIDKMPSDLPMGEYSGKTPLHLILQLMSACPAKPSMLKLVESCRSRVGSLSCSDGEGAEGPRSGAETPIGETDHSTETRSIDSRASEHCAGHVLDTLLGLLLGAFPRSLRERCSAGRLPIVDYIELCARPAPDVIQAVVKANPQALMVGDHRGLTPVHILLNKPEFPIEALEIMLQYCPESSTVPCAADASLPIHTALRNTHPDVQMPTYLAAKMLLDVYPGAADQPDSKGFLPIHLLVSRSVPDTSLLRRLLAIHPLGAEMPTCEEAGYLLPLHCAVVATRPSKAVIELVLDAYPEGLQFCCAANLCPLDYLFLNMKSQYGRRNMLRSATPSLRVPARMEQDPEGDTAAALACSERIPRSAGQSPSSVPALILESVESLSTDLIRDLALLVDVPDMGERPLTVDNGDTIAERNNSVMSYFKDKTDEEILYFTLDLLKNNNFEVTDAMIVMFGSRLREVSDITDDLLMFRGDFQGQNIDDGCQCTIM